MLVSYTVHAQLTRAQVYDFEVGDVFQVSTLGAAKGPGPTRIDTITAKYYSADMDTLYYNVSTLTFTPESPWTEPSYNYGQVTRVFTNLDNPASHYGFAESCLPSSDTSFTNYCGAYVEQFHSNADETCFEAVQWHSELHQGLGGPYYYRYDPVANGTPLEWFAKQLTYFNTSQYGECGSYSGPNGIKEINGNIHVSIYPNPALNELVIYTDLNNWKYSIYTYEGKIIATENVFQRINIVDVSALKPRILSNCGERRKFFKNSQIFKAIVRVV